MELREINERNMNRLFTKKRVVWGAVIIVLALLIVGKVSAGNKATKNIVSEEIRVQQLRQTVLATGQIVSGTDLVLSFR